MVVRTSLLLSTTLITLGAAPVAAQTAKEVIDRYVEVIGGREALDAIETVRTERVLTHIEEGRIIEPDRVYIIPPSRYLAVAGGDVTGFTEPPSFAIWDVEENQLYKEDLGEELNFMGLEAHFSPDDQAILYLGFPGFPDMSGLATAYAFDVKSGEIINTFTPGGDIYVRSAAWSPQTV